MLLLLSLGVLVLAAGAWWLLAGEEAPTWRTVELTRGPVVQVVSATGVLEATTRVDVGTQVSGILAEVLVDFNDAVLAGQVLARIDPSLLDADVAAATARLAEADATRARLGVERDRAVALHKDGVNSDTERDQAQTAWLVADAQTRAAKVALDRARRNLTYATIASPIDGTVIKRSVEPGQTVSASLSAPTLFVLAGDLTQMQILARVDESDIGLVSPGQRAKFTVPAFPDREFEGTVRQVRLESVIDQNVVTYAVVVDAKNPERALLPGMTATVEFVVAEAAEALCAPNAALRFRPEAGVAVTGLPAEAAEAPGRGAGGPPGGSPSARRGGKRPSGGTLYVADAGGLRGFAVETGLRSSACTEVKGEGLEPGMKLVAGVERATESGTASPFAPRAAPRGR